MAALSRIATSSVFVDTPATGLVVPVPAGIAAGDVLIVAVACTGTTFTPPAGGVFTFLDAADNGAGADNIHLVLYYRVVTGAEAASYTWTAAVNATMWGFMIAYRGYQVGSLVYANITTPTNTTVANMPAVNVMRGGRLLTVVSGRRAYTGNAQVWSDSVGTDVSLFAHDSLTAGSDDVSLGVFETANLAAAATIGRTMTGTQTEARIAGWSVGIPTLERFITAAGGIASGEAWGTPTLRAGGVAVQPAGIPSAEAWGTPVLLAGGVDINPAGIGTGEVWGTPVLLAGGVALQPAGIGSGEAWGTPTLAASNAIEPEGIPSGEAWGTPALLPGGVAVAPAGIGTGEAWGTPTLAASNTIEPAGIGTGEAWGTPTLSAAYTITPAGIPSGEAWGTPTLLGGATGGCLPWELPTACLPRGWDADPHAWTATQVFARDVAQDILNSLTGHMYSLCPRTVRPCRQGCAERQGWRAFGAGWIGPYPDSAALLAFGCGCTGSCSCVPLCEVALTGPVYDVSLVKVDGVPLPASAYRVDNNRLLVRVDGECWPQCQDMRLPDTEPGTFSVTYLPGLPLPPAGQRAVAAFAGEIAKACAEDASCRLPRRVTEVVREGVTYTLLDTLEQIKGGFTGLPEVDAWIYAVNPNGARRPLSVYSPDLRRPRITTWPVG